MVSIAIGVGKNKNVEKAVKNVNFDVLLAHSEDELIEMIENNEADAYVRGSLSSSIILKLRKMGEIHRASLIETNGKRFFLTPVGIDEGRTLKEKLKIIKKCYNFLKNKFKT